MKRIKLISILLFSLVPVTALAAPTIKGATGNFTNSQKVTISGSGFDVKNPAAPLLWDNFENGSVGSSIDNQAAMVGAWNSESRAITPIYSSDYSYDGSKSALIRFQNGKSAALAKSATFNKYYFEFRGRIVRNDNRSRNWKIWNLYNFTGGRMEHQYVQWCKNGSTTTYSNPTGAINDNTWHSGVYPEGRMVHFQVWGTESAVGKTGTGLYVNRVDGKTIDYITNKRTREWDGSWKKIVIGELWQFNDDGSGCGTNSGARFYVDNVYIDNTLARVEIGNASTYEASNHREIQIPSRWSIDSIDITFNNGSFKPGDLVYLYVVDQNGSVNQEGYPVRIGEASANSVPTPIEPAPIAPQNLKIVGF